MTARVNRKYEFVTRHEEKGSEGALPEQFRVGAVVQYCSSGGVRCRGRSGCCRRSFGHNLRERVTMILCLFGKETHSL